MHDEPEIFTLDNGLTVALVNYPDYPSVSLDFYTLAGAIYETNVPFGTAHFVEHMLFLGTKKWPAAKKLNQVMPFWGAYSNGHTSFSRASYTVKITRDNIEKGLEFLGQIICHPLLSDQVLPKEKKVILNEYNRMMDNPVSKFMITEVDPKIYPGKRQAQPVMGSSDSIKSINLQNIHQFYSEYYSGSNSILAICGDLKGVPVKKLVAKYFDSLKSGRKQALKSDRMLFNKRIAAIREDYSQAKLWIEFPAVSLNNLRKYTYIVLGIILGGNESSRLFETLRIKHGLVYNVSAYYDGYYSEGYLGIDLSCPPEALPKVLKIIKNELEKLAQKKISAHDYQKLQNSVIADSTYYFERPANRNGFWIGSIFIKAPPFNPEDHLKAYKMVTYDDIQNTAQKLLTKDFNIYCLSPLVSQESLREMW